MPRVPSPRNRAGNLLIAGLLLGPVSLAGCGTPPELRDPPGSTLPPLTTPSPTPGSPTAVAPTTPARPTATTTPGFPEYGVVDCAGRPSKEQLINLLRRTDNLLARGTRVTVTLGPLCAGDWQYSVVQVPDREPMQVVSEGPPGALKLVTAGTEVCSIPVRTSAPPGIRTAACEAAPGTTGGL